MKIKFSKIITTTAGCGLLLAMCAAVLKDDGIAGRTGAPGETNCTNCHKAAVNSGGGSISISSNIPKDGYKPNIVYKMTVTISQTGVSLFGLGVEALNDNNSNAGTLIVTNSGETKLLTSAGKTNVVHQLNGGQVSTPGAKTFTFDWKAPATDIGNVTFYAAGLAANGDTKDDAGDKTYTTKFTVSAASVASVLENKEISVTNLALFPNPSQDNVNLRYELKKDGLVTIELYNANGDLLNTLFSDIKNAGSYTENYNLKANYASGIYFIKIKTDNQITGHTLILE